MRDHEPLVIESFNGWWARGDAESAPSDHFIQAENLQYFNSGITGRDPLDTYEIPTAPALGLRNIIRIYDYVMQSGPSLLVLTEGGTIYHVIGPTMRYGPILTIAAMEDFGFVAINGRAYITPFKTYITPVGNPANPVTVSYELGLQNEFVYVYNGDGTQARKAAGVGPVNGGKLPFHAYPSANDGIITEGIHIIAVGFNNGILGTEVFPVVIQPTGKQLILKNIPIGPAGTTSRNIAITQAIKTEDYKPGVSTHQFYRANDLLDNVTTTLVLNNGDDFFVGPYIPGAPAAPVSNALLVQQINQAGFCDFGFHLIGIVYETDSGYLTAPGPENFGAQTYVDTGKAIKISNIPVSPSAFVKKRHIVSTKAIVTYSGNQKEYQFFFVPKGTLEDNTTTQIVVSYHDADLLSDASHLLDNFSEIPAGVNLTTYHSRMVVVGEYGTVESLEGIKAPQTDNRSVARLSAPGEPEAISKVDGLIIAPLDGNPLTNAQEFRDVLYLFKRTRTFGYSDSTEEPAAWQEEVIDQGVGASVHGIAAVLDSGGVNIDYLIVADWSGLMIFNGTYARPEVSWKIEDFWNLLDRTNFKYIQLVNDSLSKKIWMTLPPPFRHNVLHADYGNGLDAKNVRWSRWIFNVRISSVCLLETTKLIMGATGNGL